MTQIPHPGADPRLAEAARILTECAYVDGDFGDQERTPEFLEQKADYLASRLQGAYEDVCAEWLETRKAGAS